jgi:hypothetical protein
MLHAVESTIQPQVGVLGAEVTPCNMHLDVPAKRASDEGWRRAETVTSPSRVGRHFHDRGNGTRWCRER